MAQRVELSGSFRTVFALCTLVPALPLFAQDSGSSPTGGSAAAESAVASATPAPQGLLPIPDYSGDLWKRPALTGDWWGTRTDLARKGVQVDVDWNQYVQGIASGGRDNETRYGGNFDYLMMFDLAQMGVTSGLIKFRAESRYGESVNALAGPVLPVNTDAFFPLTDEIDGEVPFTITTLMYTHFFSPKFAAFVGKIDTLDGDPNEFASGRGTSQFMNANFVFNSVTALRLPYSTLGAGVLWMPVQGISINSSIINTADSSTTTGFEDFGDGMTWTAEVDFQYKLGKLPGGANIGGLYSFDQEFAKLNSRFVLTPGEGISLDSADDTWALYASAWQYIWAKDAGEAPISLANGTPDHIGIGLFARAGIADEDTNPVEWSLSGGIGARGLIPTRDNDTLGIGYYYSKFQTLRLSGIANLRDSAQGFEAYYNLAITPAANVTFDVQAVESASESVDTAVVLGVRVQLSF